MKFAQRMKNHYEGGKRIIAINQHNFLKEQKLYKTEGFGWLEINPEEKRVAEKTKLILTYHAGTKSIKENHCLKLFIVGFNPLSNFTTNPAESDKALIKVKASKPVEMDVQVSNGFCQREIALILREGILVNGDTIDIIVGENKTLKLSEASRSVVFYLEFRGKGSEKTAKLVDRVILQVRPGRLKNIRCIVPSIIKKDEPQDFTITALDKFGNIVDNAHLDMELASTRNIVLIKRVRILPGDKGKRKVCNGLTVSSSDIYKVKGYDTMSKIEFVSNPVKCVENNCEYQLYFGDIHAHDFLSPGLAGPGEYYQNAKELGLHFLALPIQTHGGNLTHDKWLIANFMTEEFYQPDSFVTFPAFEWQHYAFGHKNVYYLNPDQPFLSPYDKKYDTPDKLFRALKKSDALVAAHHPGYCLDAHVPGTDWNYVDEYLQPVVEICSCHGSSEKPNSERPLNKPGKGTFFQEALAAGIHIGVISGSDSHSGWPVNSPREPRQYPGGMACVYAKELTRKGIFEALRARRCYGTTGAKIILEFTINGHDMGEIIESHGERKIRILAAGTNILKTIEIIKDAQVIHSEFPAKDHTEILFEDHSESGFKEDFYYVKVIQKDGELAWSSPIWVKR